MNPERHSATNASSVFIRIAIAVAGVATIVASGGGGAGSGCTGGCGPSVPTGSTPAVLISPVRQTVQVGTPATLSARISNLANPVYQWCRSPAEGQPCANLPEASGPFYTIASARLEDDGARFQVTVTGNEGSAVSGFSELAVSSMPGVIFRDGEFAPADWSVDAITIPAQGGPIFTVARIATDGNPGAYRRIEYFLAATNQSVSLHHTNLVARYDPASQGAIYRIDFAEDCIRLLTSYHPQVSPLVEQGGRRFQATSGTTSCTDGAWLAAIRPSLRPTDFSIVAGPPCNAVETCPDFSATAPPLRFGLATSATLDANPPPESAGHYGHGIDNWKVTVWRK